MVVHTEADAMYLILFLICFYFETWDSKHTRTSPVFSPKRISEMKADFLSLALCFIPSEPQQSPRAWA